MGIYTHIGLQDQTAIHALPGPLPGPPKPEESDAAKDNKRRRPGGGEGRDGKDTAAWPVMPAVKDREGQLCGESGYLKNLVSDEFTGF